MTRSVSDAVILMKAIMNLDFQPDVHPNIIKGVDRRVKSVHKPFMMIIQMTMKRNQAANL